MVTTISMSMRRSLSLFLLFSSLSSCSSKLLFPVQGGKTHSMEIRNKVMPGITTRQEEGNILYIHPNKNLNVKAIEECRIIKVIFSKETGFVVIAEGSYTVGYGNLQNCNVVKGNLVRKGSIIGELFPKDSISDNSLSLSMFKDGKLVPPNW